MPKKPIQHLKAAEIKIATEPPKSTEPPLVFISHDSRDAELAESFSRLLKSVSAGMLRTFRSSDKKGTEGIEFGDEWYKALMLNLVKASDVVCLLTERSLDRPWLLYEAGVAKGKLDTPVHGVALGVPLSRASTGPFFQFQNSDDSEESLTGLALQLCRRVAGLEPDEGVVKGQVQIFRKAASEALKALGQKKEQRQEETTEASIAKVMEEMKLMVRELPMRLEQRMLEGPERVRARRSPLRRFHPSMMMDMAMMMSREPGDPTGILVLLSLFREELPWLYEIGLEAYRTARSGDPQETRAAFRRLRDSVEFVVHSPLAEEFGFDRKEVFMIMHELPRMIEHLTESALPKPPKKRDGTSTAKESST